MSEKTEKMIVELKKEDRELLTSTIEAVKNYQKTNQQAQGSQKPTESDETEKHDHFSTSVAYLEDPENCPECKEGLTKFGKDYMKRELEKRKDLPLVCVECGTPVGEEEEECPTCGGKEAKRR